MEVSLLWPRPITLSRLTPTAANSVSYYGKDPGLRREQQPALNRLCDADGEEAVNSSGEALTVRTGRVRRRTVPGLRGLEGTRMRLERDGP